MNDSLSTKYVERGLITGIPRSGTTLCCYLLNQQDNVVALHEPINPNEVDFTCNTLEQISAKYKEYSTALYNGSEFEHGDQSGLDIDNPVGLEAVEGKREVTAKRGNITVSKYIGKDIQLFVKQNALFTAYLPLLSAHFNINCIVRNPVDVLLSWWTVNLPVSRGRLPAGENNNVELKQALSLQTDEFQRQLIIYKWFASTFVLSKASIIRYEDIIKTDGQALFSATNVKQTKPQKLELKTRSYSDDILRKLKNLQEPIIQLDCHGLYSPTDISGRIKQVLDQNT